MCTSTITDRRSLGNSLGYAPNTIKSDKPAIKFYDTYRRSRGMTPLDKMRYIEIESDNLESAIMDLSLFASSTPLPLNYVIDFDGDIYFAPPPIRGDNQDHNLLLSTVAEIQTFSFQKLWELEGLNPIATEQTTAWLEVVQESQLMVQLVHV
jgi:hypothetical protein